MKKHFELPFDQNIQENLREYYEDTSLTQHSERQRKKSGLKFNRIIDLISFDKHDVVVDIGCSNGYFLKKLSCVIQCGIGLDISRSVIRLAKEESSLKNLEFKCYDGINVEKVIDFMVDKVIMLDVLEHAFEPDSLIKSALKILKEGGTHN